MSISIISPPQDFTCRLSDLAFRVSFLVWLPEPFFSRFSVQSQYCHSDPQFLIFMITSITCFILVVSHSILLLSSLHMCFSLHYDIRVYSHLLCKIQLYELVTCVLIVSLVLLMPCVLAWYTYDFFSFVLIPMLFGGLTVTQLRYRFSSHFQRLFLGSLDLQCNFRYTLGFNVFAFLQGFRALFAHLLV